MHQNILVTGATGMIGSGLIQKLKDAGANVAVLSRNPDKVKGFRAFYWDINKQQIDENCMSGINTVVHLAGEPIADKKWTREQKQQIIASRVLSTALLYKAIKASGNLVKNFVAGTAVGYYGDRGNEILTEKSLPGEGFVADCCVQWEAEIDKGNELNLRIVKVRTGIVLAKNDGSLPVMAKPIKLFAGAALGSGKQWISWIHHEDIVGVFLTAIFGDLTGVFNGNAPTPVTNKYLTHQIAKKLHRPVWPFNVPKAVLNLILGARCVLPLMSGKASAQKITAAGYQFKYNTIEEALSDIFR